LVVQPTVEDGCNKIVQGCPHGVHVSLLALGDVAVWPVDRRQITGEIDAQ
jgi:hypothetical protein